MEALLRLRRTALGRLRLVRAGIGAEVRGETRRFVCGPGLWISRGVKLSIGSDVFIGSHCHVGVDLTLENDVMVASNVAFVGGDHRIDGFRGPIRLSGRDVRLPIVVGKGAWVGHGAIVLHGVTIGAGAVIGAGSVVTKSVPPDHVAAGNPARVIRSRVLSGGQYGGDD